MAVVTIETIFPNSILLPALADQSFAVGVDSLHLAINELFHHLRISGGAAVIDEILRRHTTYGLRTAIAIAVVDDSYRAAIDTDDAVVEVVREATPTGRSRIAVGVIRFVSRTIVCIVRGSRRKHCGKC